MVYTFILLGKGGDCNDNVSFLGGTDPNQTQESKARSRGRGEKGKRKDPDTQRHTVTLAH